MKTKLSSVLAGLLLLPSCLFTAHAQSPPQLRLEPRTNAFELTVSSLSATGALFIYQATNLQTLVDSPSLLLQTNAITTNDVRVSITPAGGLASRAFFSAAHWPGRSTNEFGDPEHAPDPVPPDMILVTRGAPDALVSQQTFTVDFYVTDTAGQMLDLAGQAAVLVVRMADDLRHPDAVVTPPAGAMTNGHLRLTLTLQATTPLTGYTLGLELTLNGPAGPHPMDATTKYLKSLIELNKVQCQAGQTPRQCMDALRLANTDAGPGWSYPLLGSGHPVAGTFGEWRGGNNTGVHRGLDLAAVAASTVLASRGGVVSCRGMLAGMGDYLVVDHGGGWFSRYLHLDASSIKVREGQVVARGSTILATGLYAVGNWPRHLHFEIRQGADQAQWGTGAPGAGQDPLQTAGTFAVAPGVAAPQLQEFGLTRQHPRQTAFVKSSPTASANGPVYLFAKFLDVEGTHRLGLRAVRFQPEGVPQAAEIRPQTEAAIAAFLPTGNDTQKGFALYRLANGNPPQSDWYRYWWQWDTSAYANEPKGPRNLTLTGEDHSGASAAFNFTFGPQLKGGEVTPVGGQQYQFTVVAQLGANTIAAYVQRDQYQLQILQVNGQPLSGVTWSPALEAGYSKVFTVHLDEVVYTVTLPGGTTPDGLKLRVSSRLAPDLAHQVGLLSAGMALIPAGSFTMGDPFNDYPGSYEQPTHSVYVSAFYMDKYHVTKALWDEVFNWAITHGYSFDYADSGQGKAANHPAHSMTWHDAVKWCNARSEKENKTPAYYTDAGLSVRYRSGQVAPYVNWSRGYRLPTEAEWEKAARGGASGQRFPWTGTDNITHSLANYHSDSYFAYDTSPTRGYHPTFNDGVWPYTSPVGYFAPNGYGLYDMAGNVWQWCWDWWGAYSASAQTDPRGPAGGPGWYRVIRGGDWGSFIEFGCRSASRNSRGPPTDRVSGLGFRVVLAPGQP